MKNLTKIFMAVAVAMFAFSCVQDATEDLGVSIEGQGVKELTLSLEESRTHLGDKVVNEDGTSLYPLYWSEGDAISVNGEISLPLSGVAADATSATFQFYKEVARPLSIVYPASAAVVAEEGEVTEPTTPAPITAYSVNFLAEQPYTVGTFAPQAAPMYGYAAALAEGEEETPVQLNHLTGVLRLALKGNGEKVTSIKVKAEKGVIAGPFTVDCTNGALTAQEGASNTVTVTFAEGLVLGAEATPVYLTVPAGKYGTFVITVNTEAHQKMTVKFSSDIKPINAGAVREFSEFEYAANNADVDEGDFIIDGKDALIEFARIAGTFYPRTKAVVTADIDMTGYDWKTIEYFGAYEFDGGDCTIKGLNAPLFATTAANIKNLILTDVQYTVTDLVHSGAIACNLYGNMDNCSVWGDVTINNTTFAPEKITNQYEEIVHGGMVGIAHGSTITNCSSEVDVNVVSFCDAEKSIKSAVGAMIGGAAAGCTFNGLINNGDVVYSGITQKGNIYMSGVIGKANTTEGDFGIVSINHCTNNGTLSSTKESVVGGSLMMSGITGDILPGREVTSSFLENNGTITHRGASSTISVAGIASYTVKSSISNCSNTADLIVDNGATTTTVRLAGLFGNSVTANTIDNCSNSGNFTVKKATTTENRLAGFSAGTVYSLSMTNCSNSGKMEVVTDATANAIYMAGLVSDYAKSQAFENCTNTGSFTVGDNITLNDYVQLAGLFQGVSGEDNVTPTLKNCKNSGALSTGKVTLTNTGNNGRIYMSGLIGTLSAGALVNCYNEVTGTITATNSTLAKEYMIGGLVGYISYQAGIANQVVSITDCENKAAISLAPTKVGGGYIGGIVGQAWAEKKDQTIKFVRTKNSGAISLTGATWGGNPQVAGIFAQPNNYSAIELDGCENSGDITVNATASIKPHIGGIVGSETNKVSVLVKNCVNKGNISVLSTMGSCRISGIYGSRNNANNIVTIDGCTNLGAVKIANNNTANSNAYAVGGVLGYAAAGSTTIKNCTNGSSTDATKGEITFAKAEAGIGIAGIAGLSNIPIQITGCKNYGHVAITGDAGHTDKKYVGIAGIVGYNLVAGAVVTNCDNYGLVEFGTGKGIHRINVAGIIGMLSAGTETAPNIITSCNNHGTVKYSAASCGAETTVAGVVGLPQAYTTITNCENTSTGVVWVNGICSSNLDLGGVAGGPNKTSIDITYCTNNGIVKQTKKNSGKNYIGGVVGYAYTWNKITHCTNNGPVETVGSSQRNYVGGVIGYARHMSGASEISDCVNTYPLVFTGDGGESGYWAGGLIGCVTYETTEYDLVVKNLYNVADLTFEGRATAGTLRLGGIVGHNRYTIQDSYCYGDIKAISKKGYIGLIMGTPRMFDESAGKGYVSKAVNCKVGGNLIFATEEGADAAGETEVWDVKTPITADNFHEYIYNEATTAALAAEDGCEAITTAPTVPVYTYTPAN